MTQWTRYYKERHSLLKKLLKNLDPDTEISDSDKRTAIAEIFEGCNTVITNYALTYHVNLEISNTKYKQILVSEFARMAVEKLRVAEFFAEDNERIALFDYAETIFIEKFGVRLGLQKRASYDYSSKLKEHSDNLAGHVWSVDMGFGMMFIDGDLQALNKMADDITFMDRGTVPANIFKKPMIFQIKNAIHEAVRRKNLYPSFPEHLYLFDYADAAFLRIFGVELNIPRTQVAVPPQPTVPGPMDVQSEYIILRNLHQRLGVLEKREGLGFRG